MASVAFRLVVGDSDFKMRSFNDINTGKDNVHQLSIANFRLISYFHGLYIFITIIKKIGKAYSNIDKIIQNCEQITIISQNVKIRLNSYASNWILFALFLELFPGGSIDLMSKYIYDKYLLYIFI